MLLDSTPGCHRAQNGHSLLELGFRERAVEEVGIIATKFTHLVKFMFLRKTAKQGTSHACYLYVPFNGLYLQCWGFFLSKTKIIQKYREVIVPPGGGGFSYFGVFACGVLLGVFVVCLF